MKIFSVIKTKNLRDFRFCNFSLFARERISANTRGGGGVEYVRYKYKILSIPIYKTFMIAEPDGSLCFKDLQNTINKTHKLQLQTSALVDILWCSRIQNIDYKGQLAQDLIAYIILNGKKDGFFVDIAAHDGVNINNTYMFEKLGWSGFCVEANPKTFETLRKNRKCDCYNLAVFSKNIGKTRFATTNEFGSMLDSMELTLTQNHKKRMEDYAKVNVEYIEVETTSFNDLMSNYPQVNHIDFLSLDIEGGELEVLKGIDFDKYTFGVMTIEHNEVQPAKSEIIALLQEKGYRILFQNGWDTMFVKNENIIFC